MKHEQKILKIAAIETIKKMVNKTNNDINFDGNKLQIIDISLKELLSENTKLDYEDIHQYLNNSPSIYLVSDKQPIRKYIELQDVNELKIQLPIDHNGHMQYPLHFQPFFVENVDENEEKLHERFNSYLLGTPKYNSFI